MGKRNDKLNELVNTYQECAAWNLVNDKISKAFDDPSFSLDMLLEEEERRLDAPIARIRYEESDLNGGRDGGEIIVEIRQAYEEKFSFESSYKVFMTDFPDGKKYPLISYNIVRKIAHLDQYGYRIVYQCSMMDGPSERRY